MIPAMDLPSEFAQPLTLPFSHEAITADVSEKLFKVPAGKRFRVTAVQYVNRTGLAADAANAFSVTVKNGTTVVATIFNTDSDDVPAGAALAANTWLTATLSATDANLILEAGAELDLVFDEDGTATLPAGRLVVTGRFI